MEAVVKAVKHFGRLDNENVFAIYIRTKENLDNIKKLLGKDVIITGKDAIITEKDVTIFENSKKSRWIKYTKH